jgi:hypothetical protein
MYSTSTSGFDKPRISPGALPSLSTREILVTARLTFLPQKYSLPGSTGSHEDSPVRPDNESETRRMKNIQFIPIPGDQALAELDRLRAQYPSTGLYPILVGDAEDKSRIIEVATIDEFDPAETIAHSQSIDAAQWLQNKDQLDQDELPEDGDWPKHAGQMGIVTQLNVLTRSAKKEVFIGLLKINVPWEAFAYLNWGAWNDCPEPAVHCALHRYWESKYGAQVASITGDIVQCIVERPPADKEAALHLAREQYIYCYDIVEQGTESIAALAAGLLNWNRWYFWWD